MTWPFQPLLPGSADLQSTPPPSLVDDDLGGGWGGIARNLVAVPLAIAAASLATSVAIAGTLNRPVDEVPAWLPGEAAPINVGTQRAVHRPVYVQWGQGDELPTAAAPPALDEEGWQPFVRPLVSGVASGVAQPWHANDEIELLWLDDEPGQPLTARLAYSLPPQPWQVDDGIAFAPPAQVVDEDGWWPSERVASRIPAQPWQVDDEITQSAPEATGDVAPISVGTQRAVHRPVYIKWTADDDFPGIPPTPLGVDDDYWTAPRAWQSATVRALWWGEDELGTPAAPLTVDDAYWQPTTFAGGTVSIIAVWAGDEAPAPRVDEEYRWTGYVAPLRPWVVQPWYATDEVVTAATPLGVDADPWQPLRAWQSAPVRAVWLGEDELGTPATPLGVDDDGWRAPVVVRPAARVEVLGADEPIVPQPEYGFLAAGEEWVPGTWILARAQLTGPAFDDAFPARETIAVEDYWWRGYWLLPSVHPEVLGADEQIVPQPLLSVVHAVLNVEFERRVLDTQPELRVNNTAEEQRVVNALYSTRPYDRPDIDA
jgi:hypothetical protein